jgi:hypothetical protein
MRLTAMMRLVIEEMPNRDPIGHADFAPDNAGIPSQRPSQAFGR